MPNHYILFFREASLKDVHLIGGKGANLGELCSAGFPVPQGFGITSNAFDDFLAANHLDEAIRRMLVDLDHQDYQQMETVTASIRSRIMEARIPSEMAKEIEAAYHLIGDHTPVAVRSSSAIPELDVTSFPGQMDTYFHVVGAKNLLENVKRCWASFWNPSATSNRWNKGIDHFSVKVSALVQEMVPAEFSGVAFTVNPVTCEPECVVEAVAGLGEALVSGRVTPDRFTLGKGEFAIRERTGESLVPVEVITLVVRMARAIENHYGCPQDVEWAFSNGAVHILQTRRVIANGTGSADYGGLERWNKQSQADENDIVWTRAWADEVWTRAITPAFYSLQGDLIKDTYDFIYRCYGLSELLPMTLTRFHKNRGYFSTKYLTECYRYVPLTLRDEEALKFFAPEQKEYVRVMPFRGWKKLISELRLAVLHWKYSFFRCFKTFEEEYLPQELRQIEELDRMDLNSAGKEEIDHYFNSMERLLKWHCEPIGFGVMVHTAAAITVLNKVLEKWYGDTSAVGPLLCGIPGNRTVESNKMTWRLAARIKRSPELTEIFANFPASEIRTHLDSTPEGAAFLSEMEEFRAVYAFRGAEDRDVRFPRWGDDATLLVDVLKAFAQVGDESDPDLAEHVMHVRQQRAREQVAEALSRQRFGFLKKKIFNFVLGYAQAYSLFRENQRYEADRLFYGERKGLLAIGRQLVHMGIVSDCEDVWFLSKEEARDAMWGRMTPGELRRLIPPRKAEYRRYSRETPPMFLRGSVEYDIIEEQQDAGQIEAGLLTGVGASPGEVTGVARVLTSLRELSRIHPKDILVTNSTDPAWTPAFLLIKGLVLETGGILAHGTVLSREYGLPAVTSVKNATSVIRDGQKISIDGTRGTIRLWTGDE